MASNEPRDFELRRTWDPYAGMILIVLAVTLFLFYPFNRVPDSSVLWAVPALWAMFASGILMGRTYRIFVKNDVIVQRGLGVKTFSIPIRQVKKIKLEVSLLARRKSNSFFFVIDRPLRRIVITPKYDSENYIDVSLKHFAAEDIRELMRRIREQKPDLSFPKTWI
jgi:hypothetical protein